MKVYTFEIVIFAMLLITAFFLVHVHDNMANQIYDIKMGAIQ